MNATHVDEIARAILYEGYILYPYRPSVKNRQRWTFGGLLPPTYCAAQRSGDSATAETQCLAEGDDARLEVGVRFLQLVHRQAARVAGLEGEVANPQVGAGTEPPLVPVDLLRVDDAEYHTWQEAVERQLQSSSLAIRELVTAPHRQTFSFPIWRKVELLKNNRGALAGALVREQCALAGEFEIRAEPLGDHLHKIIVRVSNLTPLENAATATRDDALLRGMVSLHAVLRVPGGNFLSLLEPPETWSAAAVDCRQTGLWPVLVGEACRRDTLLASPIILYDYPQVAAESPGDLFDGGEIDEILTLRIMTLTDDEKRSMAAVDPRARALLERTESLAPAALAGLHGAMRRDVRRGAINFPGRGETEHAI